MSAISFDLRIGKAKVVLKKQLQVELSNGDTSSQILWLVTDGSAVMYPMHWPMNKLWMIM